MHFADSSSDEVSSEYSFFSPAVQGHVNSRLLMMPGTPSHTQRQQMRQQSVNKVLQWQGQKIYVPAMVMKNSKENAIRRYSYKLDLDGFSGAETNINWKKMSDECQLLELFGLI
jgi:hypothetical protein